MDISVTGLRFCPELDAAVSALTPRPANSTAAQAASRTFSVLDGLRREDLAPRGEWKLLDDDAVAHAIARVYRMARGMSPLDCAKTQSQGITADVLPLTSEPIELHALEEGADGTRTSRHALRWIEDPDRGALTGFAVAVVDRAIPAAGVLDAIRSADVVVLPPMLPTLDAAGFLAVPGVRDALQGTSARVVVISPIGLPDGYDADVEKAAWSLTGMPAASTSIASLYADFADALVIDDDEAPGRYPAALNVTRTPLRSALGGDVTAMETLRAAVVG